MTYPNLCAAHQVVYDEWRGIITRQADTIRACIRRQCKERINCG